MLEKFLTLAGSECSLGLTVGFSVMNSVTISWYSLSYIFGFLVGSYYIKHINTKILNYKNITSKLIDDLLLWIIIGTILGGRIGYALFYSSNYYFNNPHKIIYIWEGGMSFHGALIGIAIATFIFAKKQKIVFLTLTDLVCCAAPIGIFLGRISNFLNGELWGKTTTLPWGMIFPCSDLEYRHPSQLYEALLEGVLIYCLLYFCIKRHKILDTPGKASGIFLCVYAIIRILVEIFFRLPDKHIGYIYEYFTMGMILSLPLLILGMVLINKNLKIQR